MKKFLILIFLFSFSCGWAGYKYDLSICAMFQNEAEYLTEWIEYHRLLGVEHFYLYNHNSKDNYQEILNPYIKKKIVEVIEWPGPENEFWIPHQMAAYNDCIKKVKKITRWLAVIDIDEYIVPITSDDLPTLLKDYEGAGGLQIFWQFFGTSGVKKIPSDMTMTESLTQKAVQDHPWNYNFKTICQPIFVKKFHVHGADYFEPWFGIFPHGTRGGAQQPINVDIVRLHHYWTRDEDYFLNKKVPRRQIYEGSSYTQEKIDQILFDLNQVQDLSIQRFIPELKKRLEKISNKKIKN